MQKDIIVNDLVSVIINYNDKVEKITLTKEKKKETRASLSSCAKKIDKYLKNPRETPICELNQDKLTNHQKEVYEAIRKIPLGRTRTYGEIAEEINTSPIAVGQALSKNPFPLTIPCHRVVGKNDLGGYRYGKELKKKLIIHERSLFP